MQIARTHVTQAARRLILADGPPESSPSRLASQLSILDRLMLLERPISSRTHALPSQPHTFSSSIHSPTTAYFLARNFLAHRKMQNVKAHIATPLRMISIIFADAPPESSPPRLASVLLRLSLLDWELLVPRLNTLAGTLPIVLLLKFVSQPSHLTCDCQSRRTITTPGPITRSILSHNYSHAPYHYCTELHANTAI